MSDRRPAPKNQTRSFQIGPAERRLVRRDDALDPGLAGRASRRLQVSLLRVVRNEPLNLLPPDFVIALTTPPVKRPYSAEIAAVDVVVSWIASSMKRLFGVAADVVGDDDAVDREEVLERLRARDRHGAVRARSG